jgi:membrane protein DedA with SNARE-associated domain
MQEMFRQVSEWYLHSLAKGGYWLVALLMTFESSVFPLPSEFVIPPAALLAYQEHGMSGVIGVVLAGGIGSWFGATIMYWASRLAGRPLVMRYGRLVFISPEKVAAAELWAGQYGSFGIFFSRVLPVVRHLIGIPAGIVRMDFRLYSLYTFAGSTVWCAVLAWAGVQAGQDKALMRGDLHRVTLWVTGAFLVLGSLYYFFVHRQMRAKKKS